VVCFLVSFDKSEVSTYTECISLFLKLHFRVEFFDFHVSALDGDHANVVLAEKY
jgi:hypothetical protein